jgi:hypothetical protein
MNAIKMIFTEHKCYLKMLGIALSLTSLFLLLNVIVVISKLFAVTDRQLLALRRDYVCISSRTGYHLAKEQKTEQNKNRIRT